MREAKLLFDSSISASRLNTQNLHSNVEGIYARRVYRGNKELFVLQPVPKTINRKKQPDNVWHDTYHNSYAKEFVYDLSPISMGERRITTSQWGNGAIATSPRVAVGYAGGGTAAISLNYADVEALYGGVAPAAAPQARGQTAAALRQQVENWYGDAVIAPDLIEEAREVINAPAAPTPVAEPFYLDMIGEQTNVNARPAAPPAAEPAPIRTEADAFRIIAEWRDAYYGRRR